jgi:4-hydroxy-3-polyprenylbenzoate decarboxylase
MPVKFQETSSFKDRMIVISLNQRDDRQAVGRAKKEYAEKDAVSDIRLVLAVDKAVDINDMYQVAWQILGNSDPQRDTELIAGNLLFIDGTAKVFRQGGFMRKWPNVVISSQETVECIDKKWLSLGLGPLITSPSFRNSRLSLPGNDEVNISS